MDKERNKRFIVILAIIAIVIVIRFATDNEKSFPVMNKKEIVIPSKIIIKNEVKNSHNDMILQYVKGIFGNDYPCAISYLHGTNPTLNPFLVRRNYIDNSDRYLSVSWGLFSLNDSSSIVRGYTVNGLFDYKLNTRLAYMLFKD